MPANHGRTRFARLLCDTYLSVNVNTRWSGVYSRSSGVSFNCISAVIRYFPYTECLYAEDTSSLCLYTYSPRHARIYGDIFRHAQLHSKLQHVRRRLNPKIADKILKMRYEACWMLLQSWIEHTYRVVNREKECL